MNERPVLIDTLKYEESILGFVALAINLLYNTSWPKAVTLQAKFNLLARVSHLWS